MGEVEITGEDEGVLQEGVELLSCEGGWGVEGSQGTIRQPNEYREGSGRGVWVGHDAG